MRTLAAFAAIYVIWGSTYLAIAYAIESIPPLLMMGVRSLLAGVTLYGWARWSGAARPTRESWGGAIVAGAFLFLGSHGLLAWAEQRVPTGLAALVIATGTFWMLGVEWARPGGRRPTVAAFGGAVLGLAGVGVLLGTGDAGIDMLGAGALTLSALLWAIGSVYARGSSLPSSPQLATALPLLAGGVMLVIASLITGEARGFDVRAVEARALWSLLYLVVFGSIVGFTAYVWLLRTTSAVRVSTHNFVNPVVAVVLGWTIAGEPVTTRAVIAGVIIVASIVVIHLAGTASPPATRISETVTTRRSGWARGWTRVRTRIAAASAGRLQSTTFSATRISANVAAYTDPASAAGEEMKWPGGKR